MIFTKATRMVKEIISPQNLRSFHFSALVLITEVDILKTAHIALDTLGQLM